MSRHAKGRLFLFNLVLLFLVLTFAFPLLAEGPGRAGRWQEINSPNFHIITDSRRSAAVRVAQRLEVFRDLLTRRGYPVQQTSSAPTTIVIFHKAKDMLPYGSLERPEGMRCVGFSLPQPWVHFLVLDGHPPHEDLLDSALRGYMQLVFANDSQHRPLWFRTGMTEYYRTFRLQRDTVRFGEPVEDYLLLLRTTRGLPMESFFAIDETALDEMDPQQRDLYTAQSWGLVHYLFAGSSETKLRAQAFLQALADGATVEKAFARHFETDFAGLEERFHDDLKSRRLAYQEMQDPEFSVRVPVSTATLAPQDLNAELGLLLVLSGPGRTLLAETHFQEALARDPEHKLALTGLALAKDQDGAGVEAERLFRRAIQGDEASYLTPFLYARHLEREWREFRDPGNAPWCEVRELLARSIERRPEFFPAHLALVSSYLEDPQSNTAAAMAAVEQALSLRPRCSELRLGLALLYMQAGNRERAEEQLAELRSPDVHSAARKALARQELVQAREFLVSDARSLTEVGSSSAMAILRTPDAKISHEYPVLLLSPQVGAK